MAELKISNIRRKLLVSLFFLVITPVLLANDSFNKFKNLTAKMGQVDKIHIDNEYLQLYRGHLGLWKKSSNFSYYSRKFGVSVEKIKELNGISGRYARGYVFYPYSEEYLKSMADIGIERLKWQVPRAEFLWPVKGIRITSRIGKRWGKQHTGIDIAAARGSIVVAAKDGEVTYTGYNGAFGVSIHLSHADDYTSLYGHLTTALVKKGDFVKKGQIIGLSGNTGRSTGPHLHFEVRCMGIVLNPEFFLPSFDESMQTKTDHYDNLRSKKQEINKL